MSGSIWKQGDRYVVGFWWKGKQWKATRYNKQPMYVEKQAVKCLALIQGRLEQHYRGECVFRPEEFVGKGGTDILDYYETWMRNVIIPKRKPATVSGYWSYYRNWIKPFFENKTIQLHEVQLDTLTAFLNSVKLTGKGKMNVIMAFRSMMDYAWRSKRIPSVPPFPKREDYNIVEPTIKWLTEDRQMRIIEAIPEVHRPIFLWLKYHYRRPSEACALRKEDYDVFNSVFIIRRSISARKLVQSTKTGTEHIVSCHPSFAPLVSRLLQTHGSSFFVNQRSRREDKRYTNESLNILWKAAARKVGEHIDLYSGLKHSSCSQAINESGLSIHDVQVLTQHARLESVRKYAKVELSRQRELMERTIQKPKLRIVKEGT